MKTWIALGSAAIFCLSLRAADWKPIVAAELAEKKPVVEANAGAEALIWEVRVTDEQHRTDVPNMDRREVFPPNGRQPSFQSPNTFRSVTTSQTVLDHYIRIKIFNNSGRDRFSTVHIPYSGSTKISDISGRTIQPDGSILELSKESIFDSDTKWGTFNDKSKAFPMPGVMIGSIIEYRWRETRPYIPGYQVLEFQQRDLPVRLVRYLVKPTSELGAMLAQSFQCALPEFVKESGGYYRAEVKNIPALKSEPFSPPYNQQRAWGLLYYRKNVLPPERYWQEHGVQTYNWTRGHATAMAVNKEVKQLASEITQGATKPEDKVDRLAAYCRSHLRNRDSRLVSAEERKDFKPNQSPADTLSQKIGTPADIRNAFGALAVAAGFEARVVEAAGRNNIYFQPSFADSYFLGALIWQPLVAVRVGESWRLYDPASRYTGNMLPWWYQGVPALISDSRNPVWVRTPIAPPDASAIQTSARLRLSDDGTLEGDASIEFTGIEGALRKQAAESRSAPQREEDVKNLWNRRWRNAELSDIKVENADDLEKNLIHRFHVRIPGYASVTGKRLSIAPALFQQGLNARFTAKERTNDIVFNHPWMELDNITIDLPAGYELDNADMPNPFKIEKTGSYESKAAIRGGNQLLYARRFIFGEGGLLQFPANSYDSLKKVFDAVHDADIHTITLKVADGPKGPAL